MAINLRSTLEVANQRYKFVVYGASKVGKTTLGATMPGNKVFISSENGLLSISDQDIAFIDVASITDLNEAYLYLNSPDGDQFDSIIIDSVTDLGNIMLVSEKKNTNDGRQAYGALNDAFAETLRNFRSIENKHVLIISEMQSIQDEQGRVLYGPSMPGKTLTQQLPYLFDAVLPLRAEKNVEGETVRALMTETDGIWAAGIRKPTSIQIDLYESPPNMATIIEKLSNRGEGHDEKRSG